MIDDSRVVEENPGDYRGGNLSSGSQSELEVGEEGQELGDTGSFNTTQQGGLDGTSDAQSQGSGVQMLGVAMGAMYASQCGPHNAFACAAAAMSFADAMSGSSAQNAAYQTSTYIDPTSGYNGDESGIDPLVDQQIQDGIQQLADSGFTLNGDGSVSGPNGETYTSADLQSADGLIAKGATPEQAAQFLRESGDIRNAAANKAGVDLGDLAAEDEGQAVSAAGGGFGADDSSGGSGIVDGADTYIEEIEIRKKKKGRGLAEAAASQLATTFNGDPIGIGMGNLFMIVNQKYGSENKKKRFFNREIVNKGR